MSHICAYSTEEHLCSQKSIFHLIKKCAWLQRALETADSKKELNRSICMYVGVLLSNSYLQSQGFTAKQQLNSGVCTDASIQKLQG